ncbi:4-hydroxy-tetrahydrodipicolinate reductase [Peptostreptococcus faecalis]|uniref:4-hydroxy-tetrahydrodipicolinate reductase n=1 Tax=Peptostreptococcus faecalis TaxID=2045015 RepID=UPI000C7A2B32|nr:4-hydroxy-tetrahydrodipicolinate reductase [Peptostreptococcus faecalis]
MKILLSGYGTMGKVVESLAIERNHEIVGVFSKMDIENSPYPVFNDAENLPESDVIIDFSHPDNISAILEKASSHKTPIVVATTGAREKLQDLMDSASKYCPIFFSANMSYGVHVFTEALKFLTPLLSDGFDIEIIEKHHNRKIDAPSGTAVKLLEAIQSSNEKYYPIFDRSQNEHKRDGFEVGMSAVRGGTIVGEHEVLFAGTDEVIEIVHRAQSKKIFADGAIKAAQAIIDKPAGFYTFENI